MMKKILLLLIFIASTNTYAEIYMCELAQRLDNLTNKIDSSVNKSEYKRLIEVNNNSFNILGFEDKNIKMSCSDVGGELFVSSNNILCKGVRGYCKPFKDNNEVNKICDLSVEFNKTNKIWTEKDKTTTTYRGGRTFAIDTTSTYNCKVGKLP